MSIAMLIIYACAALVIGAPVLEAPSVGRKLGISRGRATAWTLGGGLLSLLAAVLIFLKPYAFVVERMVAIPVLAVMVVAFFAVALALHAGALAAVEHVPFPRAARVLLPGRIAMVVCVAAAELLLLGGAH